MIGIIGAEIQNEINNKHEKFTVYDRQSKLPIKPIIAGLLPILGHRCQFSTWSLAY